MFNFSPIATNKSNQSAPDGDDITVGMVSAALLNCTVLIPTGNC
jgi:hypothetical protein